MKQRLVILFEFLLIFGSTELCATPLMCEFFRKGIDYCNVSQVDMGQMVDLNIFRIDLSQYKPMVVLASQWDEKGLIVRDFVKKANAVIGVNGGFFSPEKIPLGVRLQQGKLLAPYRNISWWGIFAFHGTHLEFEKQIDHLTTFDFAIQSGPRLLIHGEVPSKLKEGVERRTLIGMDKKGRLLLGVTGYFGISLNHLAKWLQTPEKEGGFDCEEALNLDGGSSSQLFASLQGQEIDIPNFGLVSDAVVVVPRETV